MEYPFPHRRFLASAIQAGIVGIALFPGVSRAENCPDSFDKWNRWRTDTVKNVLRPEDFSESGKLIEECLSSSASSSLLQDPKLRACLAPMAKVQKFMALFVLSEKADQNKGDANLMMALVPNGRDLGPDDQKDLNELDTAYTAERIQSLLKISSAQSPEVETSTKEVLTDLPKNSKVIVFESDTTGPSLVFVTPGESEDRFVHLGLHGKENFILEMNLQKKDSKGNDLQVPRAFYNTYTVVKMDGGLQLKQTVKLAVVNCLMCHRTGIMPIALKTGGFQKMFGGSEVESKDPVSWFNDVLAPKSANARLNNFDTLNMGPGIGERSPPSRTDDFLKNCAKNANVFLSQESRNKVRDAMSCSGCHNGSFAGVISYPFKAIGKFPLLLDSMIKTGTMPPGAWNPKDPDSFLAPDERKALLSCLNSEYFGGFGDKALGGKNEMGTYLNKLLEVPCPTGSGPHQSQADRSGNKNGSSEAVGSDNGVGSSGLAK